MPQTPGAAGSKSSLHPQAEGEGVGRGGGSASPVLKPALVPSP